MLINKLNKIIFPLFSPGNETYISPVLGSKNDFDTCYQLAKGWRYFKYLNVIQNISSTMWFVDDQILITKFYLSLYYEYFILLNFLLFRFFDIFKPFPISYVDKNFKNTLGIIFDDILAGFCCVLFPYIIIFLSLLNEGSANFKEYPSCFAAAKTISLSFR